MPSKIVVSRRIYLPVLIVAALLIALAIGSIGTRAQGLCEYVNYMTVCVNEENGAMRAVVAPEDCQLGEVAVSLPHEQKLTCILNPLEERITALEERLDACRACTLRRP